MKKELINKISIFFDKRKNLAGVPATEEQIKFAEKELNLKFDKDYKIFIQNFGGAFSGISVHAFINGQSMGKETIIDLTNYARRLFKETFFYPELEKCLVFSDDGSGNPIAIDPEGKIVIFDHNVGDKQIIASSFEKLIEDNFMEW